MREAYGCGSCAAAERAVAVEEVRLHDVPVLFVSAPCGAGGHQRLLTSLLARLHGDDAAPACEPGNAGLALAHDRWGRPTLVDRRTGAEAALGISYTHGPRRSWAALARGCRVGIDTADAIDFGLPYPYRRVFTDKELGRVMSLHGGQQPSAAAHLWAIKEAAVKALGCGFHTFDYREVEVLARIPGAGGLLFAVAVGDATVIAWTRRDQSAWLALAVAGPQAVQERV